MLSIIKKYKFILLFVLILLLFICINNNVSAKSISFNYNGTTYTGELPPDTADYVISYLDYNYLTLHITTSAECVGAKLLERTYGLYLVFKNKSNIYNNDVTEETCLSERRYTINLNSSNNTFTLSYRQSGYDGHFSSFSNKEHYIVYSDVDVYDSNNNVIHNNDEDSANPFYLEYNESINSYVVYSRWHEVANRGLYKYFNFYQDNPINPPQTFNNDLKDIEGWINMQSDNGIGPGAEFLIDDVNSDNIDEQRWRDGLQIIDYGTYYFCEYLPLSVNKDYRIMKFVFDEDGNCYTYNYDKTTGNWNSVETIENISFSDFSMHVVYDNYSAIIYSNFFRYDDRYVYTVSYSYDGVNYSDDILSEDYGVDIANNKAGHYRYYKEVTENRTYYFRLQVFDPENNGSIVDTKYVEVVVNGNFYLGETFENIDYYRKSAVYRILKNKLGILFYPIDVTFEFFERLSKIETKEPSITVPTVREYFTQAVIINGFTFSLNDVLQNETINQVYNIYLMFVDFIIYCLLFGLLYKVFKEFFNVGGLFNG